MKAKNDKKGLVEHYPDLSLTTVYASGAKGHSVQFDPKGPGVLERGYWAFVTMEDGDVVTVGPETSRQNAALKGFGFRLMAALEKEMKDVA